MSIPLDYPDTGYFPFPGNAMFAADLRAAADIIDRDGLTQHASHNDAGWCIAGAIDEALSQVAEPFDGVTGSMRLFLNLSIVAAHLRLTGDAPIALMRWNDTPGRTREEATAALRGGADKLDPR